jgi:hypothetical protein
VEFKLRTEKKAQIMPLEGLVAHIKALVTRGLAH